MMRTREEIEREVMQETTDYVDGDAENGPRFDHGITREDIDIEVDRRYRVEVLADEMGITWEDNPDLMGELDQLDGLEAL